MSDRDKNIKKKYTGKSTIITISRLAAIIETKTLIKKISNIKKPSLITIAELKKRIYAKNFNKLATDIFTVKEINSRFRSRQFTFR